MTEDGKWVIDAEELTRVYHLGGSEVHALRGVSLQVAQGEFVALIETGMVVSTTMPISIGCNRPSALCSQGPSCLF